MDRRITFFGGETRGSIRIANGREQSIDVVREVWFDQDIDGRWLVWAQDHEATSSNGTDDERDGANVVRNWDAIAFIEQLAQLIAEPAAFEHEPVFLGADRSFKPDAK